jgi:hypothetical protein
MLLYDFMYVDLPPEVVRRRLVGEDGSRIIALAAGMSDALPRGINRSAPGGALTAPPVVDVGEPRHLGGTTLLPLVWRAAPGGGPPLAAADLELAPLGSDRTQLTLLGRAAVPDRGPDAGRRRVIQAMMRSFLVRLTHDLERPATFLDVSDSPRQLPVAG